MIDAPQIFLITPPLREAGEFPARLAGALDGGRAASLLARFATPDPAARKAILRALCELAQPRGVAVIAEGDPREALRAGADGVHLSAGDAALAGTVRSLAPRHIVGAGGAASRDAAMAAGEAGADYLMFGEPAPDGFARPLEWRRERAAWWAEVFNTPCVVYAETLAEIADLAATGAEFIALGAAIFEAPRGPGAAMRDAMAALVTAPPA